LSDRDFKDILCNLFSIVVFLPQPVIRLFWE